METTNNNVLLFKASINYLHIYKTTLILDKNENSLLEVEYVGTSVFPDGNVVYTFNHNGDIIAISHADALEKYKFYDTKEDFERGRDVCEIRILNTQCARAYSRNTLTLLGDDSGEYYMLSSFRFINDVPVEVAAPVKYIQLDQECVARSKFVFTDGINLNEFYNSLENAIAFHPYKYTDKEGKSQVVEGKYAWVLPTAEQKAIVEELKAVMQKVREANIAIIHDTYSEKSYALNGKGLVIDCRCSDDPSILYLADVCFPEETFIGKSITSAGFGDDNCLCKCDSE